VNSCKFGEARDGISFGPVAGSVNGEFAIRSRQSPKPNSSLPDTAGSPGAFRVIDDASSICVVHLASSGYWRIP